MRLPMIAASLLTLIALPAHAQSDAKPYHALGSTPSWSLAIAGRTIRYVPAGGRSIQVARPRPIVGFNGERYQTRALTIDITHVECNDGRSGRSYHDTVAVTLGRRTLRGCGGEVLSERPAPAALIEGDWTIQAIQGRRVARGTSPRISFRGERISGNASCNNFNGSFRFEGGHLIAGRLASTRMACTQQASNAQEATILRVLAKRLSVSSNRGGKLVLTSAQGETLTLVRAPR